MKKVLMITYSFPPKGGGGVLRQLKFAKYLPQFQWQTFILTGDNHFFFQDKKLLDELPFDCRIFRVSFPDPRFLFTSQHRIIYTHAFINIPINITKSTKRIFKNIIKSLLAFLKAIINIFFVPDVYICWVPFAAYRGFCIIKDTNTSIIYSIDNPCSNHIVAFILKILTGKPWVADFKDPWINVFGRKNSRPFPFSWVNNKLQKLILTHCDICISSDKRIDNILKDSMPKLTRAKFFIIPNGFDKEDFVKEVQTRIDRIFTITYVGMVHRDMSPLTFLRAVLRLIESNAIPQDELRIIFVGAFEHPSICSNTAYQLLLKKRIILEKGMVSHEESIRYMKDSDVLLIISANVSDSKHIVPSKLYEYLASQKPIIALVDQQGICAELIRKSNSGYVISINDEEHIRDTILRLYEKFKNSGELKIGQNEEWLAPYERRNICSHLAKILNNLTDNYKSEVAMSNDVSWFR